VLRLEAVINNPEEFRVLRKTALRDGKQRDEWVALGHGVAHLFRYREISLQANARYLDALGAVDDPTAGNMLVKVTRLDVLTVVVAEIARALAPRQGGLP
jgi:hypothetical protein